MAMNNPYAAYQRYAKNPQASNSAVKVKHEVAGEEVLVGTASADGTKNHQIQSAVRKPVNYSQHAKSLTGIIENNNGMPPIKASIPQTEANRPINNQPVQSVSHYMENEVMTASPEKLTLMLYDGAIRFMNQAVIHIGGKGTEKASNLLIRAQDIYTELMSTLDMKYEVSKNLYDLYDFIKNSLIQANIKKDPALIREMITMTRDFRNTWEQAMQLVKKGK